MISAKQLTNLVKGVKCFTHLSYCYMTSIAAAASTA